MDTENLRSSIQMMELSSATVADTDIEFNSLIDSLEAEVNAKANEMTTELLFMLLDKWEHDMDRLREQGKMSMEHMLGYYVRLKVSLHHAKRHYERGYYPCLSEDILKSRIETLITKTKEARRDYYVAKRGYEGKHRADCSCRGCRCIRQIGEPGS